MRKTPIWIYDKDEQLQLILNPSGDIPHYDSWFNEQLNGAISLEFTVPATNPRVALIENDGRAVIRDRDGELIEFIIRKPQDTDGPNGPEKHVFAEGGDYELIDEWMTGYTAENVTLETALKAVTSDTRWSVGNVENFGRQSVDIKPTTVKNAIVQLIQIFGGEVRYRISATGNQITNRYIDVFKDRGQFNGRRFEMTKDIQSISYLPDSTGIKTALYGYGASGENDGPRLTFADIEWRIENGDPIDKPLGQTWVGDPKALQKWGYGGGTRHRFGEYSGQEEDPAQLLMNTWNELQRLTGLVETYETEVILLENIPGYDREPVRLGDKIVAIDRRVQPNIEVFASIVEYRQNLNDYQLDEVVIGDFRRVFDVATRTRQNERIIEERQGNWDKKETPEGAFEKATEKANEAIEEAQKRIDDAKAELAESLETIEETKINLENAQALIDDTLANPQNYEGEFVGDLIADSLIVRGPIISQNATITGTLESSNAVFLKATIEEADIIDADIVDATITGTLDGVDGTFIGDLVGARIYSSETTFVGSDLTVTNNIHLGSSLSGRKMLRFNEQSYISAGDYTIEFYAEEARLHQGSDTAGFVTSPSGPKVEFYDSPSANKSQVFQDNSDNFRLKLVTNDGRGGGIWIDRNGNIYFRNGNLNTHVFYSGGSKDGGSIDIDGNRYGMSPIDSPQTLLFDIIRDIEVQGKVKVYLTDLFAKAIEGFSVFPNNPHVTIEEKGEDYFIVKGKGLTDFQIIGNRVGFSDSYFTDLSKMSEEMRGSDGELSDEETEDNKNI